MTLFHHLWQSTLFAVLAWALTLLLRSSPAKVRYWIWLAASCKFLVPFALLVGVGSQVAPRAPLPKAPQAVSAMVESIFVPAAPIVAAVPPQASALPWVWACGFAAVVFSWWRAWRKVRSVSHIGVLGIWRPVLSLPDCIAERLSSKELEAIVVHERCHISRRDNLTAAIHMAVEAIFWFHPLVWWIEARLVEERERACDEEVLRRGSDPEVYATGILKVCEFYLDSPLVCAAGVTGSDLTKRIAAIMTHRVPRLGSTQKLLLAAAAIAAIAGPIVIGADRPAFEVASLKVFQPGAQGESTRKIEVGPDRLTMHRQTLRDLIQFAYGSRTEISGPGWLDSEDYDVSAKAARPSAKDQLQLMLRTLLAERCKLTFHRETKVKPVYALVVGKGGAKLKDVKAESTRAKIMRFGEDGVSSFQMTTNMPMLAEFLPVFLDRPVVDMTGLPGVYEVTLSVELDAGQRSRAVVGQVFTGYGHTPSIFKTVEQYGLKLEPQKQPVEILIVDHVERPSGN
jgi:uncharacterized protein (TIGR03435 family)